jgi:hypothetical protein
MKKLFFLLLLLNCFESEAFDRIQAEQLLNQRQIQLRQLEQAGGQLLLGEVTGAGKVIPIERVQILFLDQKALFKKEIESLEFIPRTGALKDLDSFRHEGLYYTGEQVRGVVLK